MTDASRRSGAEDGGAKDAGARDGRGNGREGDTGSRGPPHPPTPHERSTHSCRPSSRCPGWLQPQSPEKACWAEREGREGGARGSEGGGWALWGRESPFGGETPAAAAGERGGRRLVSRGVCAATVDGEWRREAWWFDAKRTWKSRRPHLALGFPPPLSPISI